MAVTLNLVALPVLAGLVAGTGAVASYVGGSAGPAEIAKPIRPCGEQTWPYIDGKCLTRAPERPVRLVTAPQADETTEVGSNAVPPAAGPQTSVSAGDQLATPSGLTSSDTVLHQPDVFGPVKGLKPRAKRSEGRSQRIARTYQVPAELRRGPSALIVVRPFRLDRFR